MQVKTKRLYLNDDHCFESEAMVVAVEDNRLAFDQTCFYSGGGGQPSDNGVFVLHDQLEVEIESAYSDENQIIWHVCKSIPSENLLHQTGILKINKERRIQLAKYHTVLHVLNTITLRDYKAWITGVQIGEEYSRIDFNFENFSAEISAELEAKVNEVLNANHKIKSYYISEEEFVNRKDLLRTLDVKPPVIDNKVRVVEIEGFDAQACGGTHVDSTLDVGRFSIFRTDNKGKKNKRLYVKLQ